MKENRDSKGRFLPGHDEGFLPGNKLQSKYQASYPDQLLRYFIDETELYPTLEGFAIKHNIKIRTLERWVNSPDKYPRLASVYAQCKAIQLDRLLIGGLVKKFDPQIVKFIAINNHGMKEKTESNVKTDTELRVKIDFFDEDKNGENNT